MRSETFTNSRLVSAADSSTGLFERYDRDGKVIESRPLTAAELADLAASEQVLARIDNDSTLRRRLRRFVQDNNDFLALATPTNAQQLAQLRRLTREATNLIRLALDDLNDITDG